MLIVPRIETQRTGSELRNEQSASNHGYVLQKHCHLHLSHYRISYCPEVVHHARDPYQETTQQPGTDFGFVSEQNAESPD